MAGLLGVVVSNSRQAGGLVWKRLVWDEKPLAVSAEGVLSDTALADPISEVAEVSEAVAFPFVVVEGTDREGHCRLRVA
jgi:hypothetical protein